MSNIPDIYLLQDTKKHQEQAKAFQDDMGAHFFEHTMYDVKDTLTSILALCDMEDMKQIPQVKKYIQRVTDLLHDVRLYHDHYHFNVNHVMINVINVLKKGYKNRIHINHDLDFIKANTQSDRNHLEQVLLYSLIEAIESCDAELAVDVSLQQKEQDAMIIIHLRAFKYNSIALKEITEFHNPDTFRMKIGSVEGGTEISIRLPLSFEKAEEKVKNIPADITIGKPKLTKKESARMI